MEFAIIGMVVFTVKSLHLAGLPRHFSPLVALILGIISGIIFLYPHDWRSGALKGAILGAAAIGCHSGSKDVFEGYISRRNTREKKKI